MHGSCVPRPIHLAAEFEEQRGRYKLIEQRGADEPSNDDHRQRMEDFLASLACSQGEWQKADGGGQGGHQDGRQSFQASANDHLLTKRFSLALHQMDVMRDHEDSVAGDDPKPFGVEKMNQKEAVERIQDFLKEEPILSAIPFKTPRGNLMVRHGGYDIHGVQADPNVGFPYERCLELKNEGIIRDLTPNAYSFVGACS